MGKAMWFARISAGDILADGAGLSAVMWKKMQKLHQFCARRLTAFFFGTRVKKKKKLSVNSSVSTRFVPCHWIFLQSIPDRERLGW